MEKETPKSDLLILLNRLKAYSADPLSEIIKFSSSQENLLAGWTGLYDLIVRNCRNEVFEISLRYGYGSEVLFQDYIDFIYSSFHIQGKDNSIKKRHIIYICGFTLNDAEREVPVLIPEKYLPGKGLNITRYLTGRDCLQGLEEILPTDFNKKTGFSSGLVARASISAKTKNSESFSPDDYPLISVITPTYNSAATIEQTIQSVINQNYKNVELIIIDGGSTDNTKDIIEKYQRFIDVYIYEKDRGIFDAINKGTFLSKGQYSVFIGSDDLIFCDTIETIVKAIMENSFPDFVYGNMMVLRLNGDVIEKQSFIRSKMYGEFSLFHPSLYISKAVFEEFNGFDIKYRGTSDADFELKLITSNKKGIKIDHFCSLFREGGLTFLYKNKYTEAWEIYRKNKAINLKFLRNYLKFKGFNLAIKYFKYKSKNNQ